MRSRATVLGALRTFLPELAGQSLSAHQQRALRAITQCRTPALGGRIFACDGCGHRHFAWHSCNHKACPQCGREATRRWVARELGKRINAPYFLVTFTLPSQLRGCFFGPHAREAYDLFFAAVSGALAEKLATAKGLRAAVNGFTAALHTWNQRLEFHPHIHCLVPGAGLDQHGRPVRVKQPEFLVYLPHLQAAFRQHLRQLFDRHGWQADPDVWRKDWGVHIQPAGSGAAALKYLGAYVARTAISDPRIVEVTDTSVTFRWKDREANRTRTLELSGLEFVRRYLRHVLPRGLRSVRYYGFCHPTAKASRLRVRFHSSMPVDFGAITTPPASAQTNPPCPACGGVTRLAGRIDRWGRGPPSSPSGNINLRHLSAAA
jgi:hypothetical protein